MRAPLSEAIACEHVAVADFKDHQSTLSVAQPLSDPSRVRSLFRVTPS